MGIDRAVRRHDGAWVPALGQVHRTPVARQAANLWSVVARLHGWLVDQSRCDSVRSLVDRLPLPVGRFARASRCRRRRGAAASGGDAVARPRC